MGGTTGGYRLKYIHKTKPKRGGVYYYYRRNGTEQRIKGAPGSHEFLENYNAIHASFEDPGKAPAMYGTFAKLIEEYKQDADFQKLADRTKKEDRRYFRLDKLSPVGRFRTGYIPRNMAPKHSAAHCL